MAEVVRGEATEGARRRTSIRLRVLALICLAAVPLSAERILSLVAERRDEITAAENQVRDLARRAALAQQEGLSAANAVLDVISRQAAQLMADPAACNRLASQLVTEVVGIQALAIARPDGIVACSNTAAAIGFNVSDRRYLQAALASSETIMSELFLSRVSGQYALFLTRAERDPAGEPLAVALVGLDLQWLSRIAARTAVGEGMVVDLIDGEGAIIARYPLGGDFIGRRFPGHPLTLAAAAADEAIARVPGFDGRDRIFAIARFEGTNVRIAVGVDARTLVGPIDQKIYVTAVAHLVALACFLVFAWIAAQRLIITPIDKLARSVAAVGREEAEPLGDVGVSEFVPLVDAVGDMAQRLSERNRELRSLNSNLSSLARTDALTGLSNRRSFDVQFSQDWVQARETGSPITLVIADVDNFKAYNDTFGHPAGDEVLRSVARMLSVAVSGSDFLVARYGGEEFMLLLPGADLTQGIAVAEDARRLVASLAIAHPQSQERRLTASFGVATVVPNGEGNPDALIASADAALYEAKRRGRNCVVAAGGGRMMPV